MKSEKIDKKELKVSAIDKGTVIDHIPSKSTLNVLRILNLKNITEIISVAFNLPSKSLGKKGIIKISGKSLSKNEIAQIVLLAPHCTMNVIENYKVKEKINLEIPEQIRGVGKCINPNCITNNETVNVKFSIISKKPIKIRCDYCETVMKREDLVINQIENG